MPYPMFPKSLVKMCNGKFLTDKLKVSAKIKKNISLLDLHFFLANSKMIKIDLDHGKIVYIIPHKKLFAKDLFNNIFRYSDDLIPLTNGGGGYVITKRQMDKYLKKTERERQLLYAIFK